ncbi:MAG TPA: 4-hydroxythreonine-4-phosphate dehydrogenase PdxA [Candidatus Hydrogenedentes bacterium]|nr:4-hydroxythreonine-4-phosphate dehydrogenase PdxA [Candidatus Hydrogenedentota bacterium]
MRKPRLAITMGDVNGVGPEILVKALSHAEPWEWCRPVIIGGRAAFEWARARYANCREAEVVEDVSLCEEGLYLMEGGFSGPPVQPGKMDAEAGRCAVEWVKFAVRLAQRQKVDGIVTCPINKECVHRAGISCSGHTDLIAEMTGSRDYRMCLFTDRMRIVHNTAHLSLRDAIDQVKTERITASIRIGDEALRRMGLETPRIAVAGLNPHAGEAGAFGREELEEILPAIQECQRIGIDCSGPHPPDTLFGKMRDGEFDMVIAMYHDQGHIPLKLIAMDEGVNVTLGIPLVRTSVDHGTAYDIAGKGIAREQSLLAAIRFAAQLV